MNRWLALDLLSECTGDDLWSISYCQHRKVPDVWIDELRDAFESNPSKNTETIFVGRELVSQYEGVRDIDLALKLGEYLGIDVNKITSTSLNRRSMVRAIREAVEEG